MRQIGIGTCLPQFVYIDDDTNVFPYPLTGVTLFAGASGSGKSTILDAFSFVSDCYRHGVDFACLKRGGYDAIYTQGGKGALSFGFQFLEPGDTEAATYAISIGCAKNKSPYIESELLAYRRGKDSFPIIFLQNGVKSIRYLAPDAKLGTPELTQIEFTDYKHLGLAALEAHPKFPVLASFRRLFDQWVMSDFTSDPARGVDRSLPRRHDSIRGVSLSGLVRYIVQRYGTETETLLARIAAILPEVEAIHLDRSPDDKPSLAFRMQNVETPIPITLLSDATIRLFAYALLLEEDDRAPLIMLEEPENGFDRLHCWKMTEMLCRFDETAKESQLLLTSHHPGMADVLHPSQVWVLEKDRDGFTVVERASDSFLLSDLAEDGAAIEPRWFSNRFEDKL